MAIPKEPVQAAPSVTQPSDVKPIDLKAAEDGRKISAQIIKAAKERYAEAENVRYILLQTKDKLVLVDLGGNKTDERGEFVDDPVTGLFARTDPRAMIINKEGKILAAGIPLGIKSMNQGETFSQQRVDQADAAKIKGIRPLPRGISGEKDETPLGSSLILLTSFTDVDNKPSFRLTAIQDLEKVHYPNPNAGSDITTLHSSLAKEVFDKLGKILDGQAGSLENILMPDGKPVAPGKPKTLRNATTQEKTLKALEAFTALANKIK